MKKNFPYKILMFLGAFMALALVAEAQTSVETSLYGSSNPNQTTVEVSGEVRANNSDATTTEGDPDRPMTDGNSNDGDGTSTSARNQTDLEFLGTRAISVKNVEVRGWNPEQKEEFLATVKTEAEVRSEQDLENFARGILLRDENVVSVSIGDEETELTYRLPAFLLGTFNSSLKARVEARARGEVVVRYPWYGFLYKKVVSPDELTAEIKTNLPEIDDEVVVSAELRAQVLQNLSSVLKTRHEAAMNIVANVK